MRLIASAIGALVLVSSPGARGEDIKGVWFAGGSVGTGESIYAGAVVALPGGRLGQGIAVRGSGNAGSYHYDSSSQRIEGEYLGAEVALVFQTSGPWGWANFSIGPRFTDTNLSPDDPKNDRNGSRLDAAIQADGARDGRQWRLAWLASTAPINKTYQAQLQLGRKFGDGRRRVGMEAQVLGDATFTQTRTGVFGAAPFIRRTELQIGGGGAFQKGEHARPYATVSLSSVF
jgi:hypothetical protein